MSLTEHRDISAMFLWPDIKRREASDGIAAVPHQCAAIQYVVTVVDSLLYVFVSSVTSESCGMRILRICFFDFLHMFCVIFYDINPASFRNT